MRTIRSLGAQPEPAGSLPEASLVMSAPMTAKSPLSISMMSGQPWAQSWVSVVREPRRCLNIEI